MAVPLPGPLGDSNWQNILAKPNVAESIVNGQWIEAIRAYFPAPQFIICPEGRNVANKRTDMVIRQIRVQGVVLQSRIVLAFEGKKGVDNPLGATEGAFFSNKEQLAGYMVGVARLGEYQHGLLVLGSQAALMARQMGAGPDDIHQVRFVGGKIAYNQNQQSLRVTNDPGELGALLRAVFDAATDPANQGPGWSPNFHVERP